MRSSRSRLHLALIVAATIGHPAARAQGIEPYRAQEVRPQNNSTATSPKPAQPSPRPSAAPPAKKETIVTLPPASPAQTAQTNAAQPAATGNRVEPLSNGLRLSWTAREMKKAFGPGEPSWDSRTITYPGFRVAVGGRDENIWHLHITQGDISLSSGIRPGSTKAEVQRVFGSAEAAKHDQYELTFAYDGDKLIDIGIRPAAGAFAPLAERTSPRPGATSAKAAANSILGQWWGVQSMTQVDIQADGTYTSPNGGKGTWRLHGDDLVFTGALAGWNGGRAKLTKGGWIEFLWQDQAGAAYLFQLVRR